MPMDGFTLSYMRRELLAALQGGRVDKVNQPERDALGDTRVSLEDLMKNSDFITLHCPHTPQTEGMISREMIALMKPTAYLINTARGPVVDEDALTCICID